MASLDQKECEKELHQAFTDYLGTERCDLVIITLPQTHNLNITCFQLCTSWQTVCQNNTRH